MTLVPDGPIGLPHLDPWGEQGGRRNIYNRLNKNVAGRCNLRDDFDALLGNLCAVIVFILNLNRFALPFRGVRFER